MVVQKIVLVHSLTPTKFQTIEPMATKNGNRLVIDCPADLGTIHAWFDLYNPSTADRGGREGRPISTLFAAVHLVR
jgi:hypothetical protein